MGNVSIPAPGSKGIAVVQDVQDGVDVLQIHVYPPGGRGFITLDGCVMGKTFKDESAARSAVSKALANNPVRVVNIKDISDA